MIGFQNQMPTVSIDAKRWDLLDLFKVEPMSIVESYFHRHSTAVSKAATLVVWTFTAIYIAYLANRHTDFDYFQEITFDSIGTTSYTLPELTGFGLFNASSSELIQNEEISYQAEICSKSTDPGKTDCKSVSTTIRPLFPSTSLTPTDPVVVSGSDLEETFIFLRFQIICVIDCREISLEGTQILFSTQTEVSQWASDLVSPKLSEYRYLPITFTGQSVTIYMQPNSLRKYFYFGRTQFDAADFILFERQTILLGQYSNTSLLAEIVVRLSDSARIEEYAILTILDNVSSLAGFIVFLLSVGSIAWWFNYSNLSHHGTLEWSGVSDEFTRRILKTNLRNHFHHRHLSLRFCTLCNQDQKTRSMLSEHISRVHPDRMGKEPLMCQYCVIQMLNERLAHGPTRSTVQTQLNRVSTSISRLHEKVSNRSDFIT